MKRTVSCLFIVVTALGMLGGTAYAASLIGPCSPSASYDPACDVDHDGDVDIFDIQLTASHWSQTGTWTGGGDGWALTGNAGTDPSTNFLGTTDVQPLIVQPGPGAVAIGTTSPTNGKLQVAGESGLALYATSTGADAIVGEAATIYLAGVRGTNSAESGIGVRGEANAAGSVGVWGQSDANTGVYGLSTGGNAVWGQSTNGAAIRANSTNGNGVHAPAAGNYGVFVESSGSTGIRINNSGFFGIAVSGSYSDGVSVYGAGDYAGFFDGDVHINGTCTGCLQANFAVNVGQRVLEPGDAVSIQAVTSSDFDGASTLWQVVPAETGLAVSGVVAGRADEEVPADQEGDEYKRRLVPRDGAAQPGEYVTIVYSGPMQVKVAPGASAIVAGSRLTAAADGSVRPLQTRTIDGMIVSEGAPILGVALEPVKDGLVWVLVNPQ